MASKKFGGGTTMGVGKAAPKVPTSVKAGPASQNLASLWNPNLWQLPGQGATTGGSTSSSNGGGRRGGRRGGGGGGGGGGGAAPIDPALQAAANAQKAQLLYAFQNYMSNLDLQKQGATSSEQAGEKSADSSATARGAFTTQGHIDSLTGLKNNLALRMQQYQLQAAQKYANLLNANKALDVKTGLATY